MRPAVKEYIVTFRSRYYPFEGDRRRRVYGTSKSQVRLDWPGIIHTDEYCIIKINEAKE